MKIRALFFVSVLLILPSLVSADDSRRGGWYIGFGIGGGLNKSFNLPNESSVYDNWLSGTSQQPKFVTNFKVGGTLTSRFLIGMDITMMTQSGTTSGGFSSNIAITNSFLMLTFFPFEEGLFFRAGGGFSSLEASKSDSIYQSTFHSALGYGASAGLGYAFWLGKSFNMSINLDHSRQFYSGNAAGYNRSQFTSIYLGFDWF
ncbi:MAG: hypothetical protein OEZ36_06175 [Spirochaetota bacterium]|nr:hypothetical protein [Spirochaetota bacterium]